MYSNLVLVFLRRLRGEIIPDQLRFLRLGDYNDDAINRNRDVRKGAGFGGGNNDCDARHAE